MRLKSMLWIAALALLTASAQTTARDRDRDDRSRDDRGTINEANRGYPDDARGPDRNEHDRQWRDYLKERNKAHKEWNRATREEQKDFEKYRREREKERRESDRDFRDRARENDRDRWEDQRERDRVWREFLKERRREYKDYGRADRWELNDFYGYLQNRGYRYDDRYGYWGRYAVQRSGACFYKDPNYQGANFCLNRDEDLRNVGDRFNDRISSIRVFGRTRVTIYKNKNFSGSHRTYTDDAARLGDFNDKISSIELR